MRVTATLRRRAQLYPPSPPTESASQSTFSALLSSRSANDRSPDRTPRWQRPGASFNEGKAAALPLPCTNLPLLRPFCGQLQQRGEVVFSCWASATAIVTLATACFELAAIGWVDANGAEEPVMRARKLRRHACQYMRQVGGARGAISTSRACRLSSSDVPVMMILLSPAAHARCSTTSRSGSCLREPR